ncbi:hypothetical protein [Metabacillus fastidiosus]|nr:hypothetical protein [Metabacillus fastidiosus]
MERRLIGFAYGWQKKAAAVHDPVAKTPTVGSRLSGLGADFA